VIADSSSESDADEASEDANNYNDYSVTRKGLVSIPLPGSVERGIFVPKRRVQFFSPRAVARDGEASGAQGTKNPAN
jgi:hypothetical protein